MEVLKQFGIILFISTTIILISAASESTAEDKEKVVFENIKMINFRVKEVNVTTGLVIGHLNLSLENFGLANMNITKEQLESGKLTRSPNISEITLPDGRKLQVDLQIDEVLKYNTLEGKKAYTLSKSGLMRRTIDDLTDPSLIPMPHPDVLGIKKVNKSCRLKYVTVRSLPLSLSITLNEEQQINLETSELVRSSVPIWHNSSGIFVTVVNPSTCQPIFTKSFYTNDFGSYRDLIWILQTIQEGHLVITASIIDGSVRLGKAVEYFEKKIGSKFAKNFLVKDGWLTIFYKGGKFSCETLLPNLNTVEKTSSPYETHVVLNNSGLNNRCYSKWPTSPEWILRRDFCESRSGFGKLCDCEKPFEIKKSTESNPSSNNQNDDFIPMVILAGERLRHLFRLIESVGSQEKVTRESFLISLDGEIKEVLQLTKILGLKTLIHKRNVNITGAAHVSANLQFGLFNALKIYPNAKNFILLEEDLLLAPDFYAYMRHLSPMFEIDQSIYCVSAFNHLSFPHSSLDPRKILRVETMPAYGWMVSRPILIYLLPKMLPEEIDQDWDYYIGSELIRQNREILIPEISRSYHWATSGLHVKGSWAAEFLYLSKNLNNVTDVNYSSLESLKKENYEKEFTRRLKEAIVLKVDSDLQLVPHRMKHKAIDKDKNYVLFVQKKSESDQFGYRIAGDLLGVWTMDGREHHRHTWVLRYKNATLFVVGVPISPYVKLFPKNVPYIQPTENTKRDLEVDKIKDLYSQATIKTHSGNFNMPELYNISLH